jgi:hypothetical protein
MRAFWLRVKEASGWLEEIGGAAWEAMPKRSIIGRMAEMRREIAAAPRQG